MDAASEGNGRDVTAAAPGQPNPALTDDAVASTDDPVGPAEDPIPTDAPAPGPSPLAVASNVDAAGGPVHRGWAPIGPHHRWMEPFVLAMLATGAAHGYAILGELRQLGITNGSIDVGQVYRTLRDLEEGGQIRSTWSTGTGPARRDYQLTELGFDALDEWAAVMKERARLVAEFDARYLEWLSAHRRS